MLPTMTCRHVTVNIVLHPGCRVQSLLFSLAGRMKPPIPHSPKGKTQGATPSTFSLIERIFMVSNNPKDTNLNFDQNKAIIIEFQSFGTRALESSAEKCTTIGILRVRDLEKRFGPCLSFIMACHERPRQTHKTVVSFAKFRLFTTPPLTTY